MRRTALFSGSLFFVIILLLSVMSKPAAAIVQYTIGVSYFEGVSNSNGIPVGYDGANNIWGSVMPNWDSSQDTSTGAGALGTKALGISPNANNQQRKQALYDLLVKKYNSGSAWEKMGSALIVNQMLGKQGQAWGNSARTIDSQEWSELKVRLLNNPKLVMDRYNYEDTDNTIGIIDDDGQFDAIRYYVELPPDDAWVFTVDGSPIYALEVICANPLGSLPGLPPAKYSLTPSASIDKSIIEPDESVSVTNSVRNGSSSLSSETDWRLTKIEYKPGTSLSIADTKGRDSDNDPCSEFTSAGRSSCQTVQRSQKEIFNPNSSKTYNPAYVYTASINTAVGTKICFTTSVSTPTREASPVWRHSSLQCVIVGKKPKMQVWGGDVRVGDMINTSTSTFNSVGRTYGSWGEYAALSNKSNSGFASGSGLNKGSKDSMQPQWSGLTFANTGGGSCSFGCYGFTSYAPSLTAQFTSSVQQPLLNGSQNLSDIGSGTYRANNLTITGGMIGSGKTVVIVATGTVMITGNITYSDGPYTNIADIPQVVVRADTINIAGSVGNIDAWLMSTTLNTCVDQVALGDDRLTANMCSNPLKINGPVVTDKLYLRRTAGSSGGVAGLDDPAETFNLRADALLWGSGYGSGSGKVQTVYTKELPPRF